MSGDINKKLIIENNKELKRLVGDYLERSYELNIKGNLPVMPKTGDGDIIRRRQAKRHLRAYMTQILNSILLDTLSSDVVYLLFDEDGYQIRFKATELARTILQKKGIVNGSCWTFDKVGANAVAIGMLEKRPIRTVGHENYQGILRDYAIYYAPIIVPEKGHDNFMGGVALLVPAENQHDSYMLTTLSMSASFAIRMQMAWNTSDAYETHNVGMAQIDVNTANGRSTLTHHNYSFFDVLGIPRMSMKESYFTNLDDYIDPLPLNKDFWSIINETQEVSDLDISITSRGKSHDFVITTRLSVGVHSNGLLLSITTRKQIARQAAEKTGNNAVLSFDNVIGSSPIMKSRIKRAKLLAKTESNIMLLGESGVGKDVFAQAIHNQSSRWKEPFVAVNCGAIPRDLIASELFGYEGGAFTGAKKQGNIGKFELANGGTLFLDEIGEMPLDLQATLLRAVEQKSFMRLGGNKLIHADVKIISATNVDITQMIQEKKFRADLYYRLCTMSIFLPPLRERGNDIVLLAEYFIRKVSDKIGREDYMEISEPAKELLKSCEWQGNVRELQNLIECLVQLYPDPVITPELIMENINPAYYMGIYGDGFSEEEETDDREEVYKPTAPVEPESKPMPMSTPVPSKRFEEPLPEKPKAPIPEAPEKGSYRIVLTREDIIDALERTGGNRSKAAELLGVGRRTLYRYIDQLGIGYK